MITLHEEITITADGRTIYSYNWILQSEHHFLIRINKSREVFEKLKERYSKWMTKTVLDPELISINRMGTTVMILETEFV